MKEPIYQEKTRTENVTRPGATTYYQTYVQPIIQRENIDVKVNRVADKTVIQDPIVEPTKAVIRTTM